MPKSEMYVEEIRFDMKVTDAANSVQDSFVFADLGDNNQSEGAEEELLIVELDQTAAGEFDGSSKDPCYMTVKIDPERSISECDFDLVI